jgi:hypothetical protein
MSIARKGWDKDLADGLANEDRLEKCLRYGKVKRDYLASETGRVFVEFWNNRRNSGLKVTEADHWAFTLGDEGAEYDLIVPTPLLKKIFWYFAARGEGRQGGDDGRTAGVLVPLDAFNPLKAKIKYDGFDSEKWVVGKATPELMREVREKNLDYFKDETD